MTIIIAVFLVPEKFHIPKLEEDQRYVITKLDTDIYQMILRYSNFFNFFRTIISDFPFLKKTRIL